MALLPRVGARYLSMAKTATAAIHSPTRGRGLGRFPHRRGSRASGRASQGCPRPRSSSRPDDCRCDRPAQLRRGPGHRRLREQRRDRACHCPHHWFALHNATEGFAIVGPLGSVRPSWRWLGLARLIGGRPSVPRRDGRLRAQLRTARARLLRPCRGRHPVRHRRGLKRNASRRTSRIGSMAALRRLLAGVATDLVVVYGGG